MKKILILIFSACLILSSCERYLDINQDPNAPATENVTSSMILPGAEMQLSATYGNLMRIVGGYYAQQYAHSFGTSNYLDYSQFKMSATRSSTSYSQLTSKCLKNLEILRGKATEEEDWGTYLAATTLRAFTYQVLVDCYGEVPYTESLDPTNLSPKYDDGKTVYNGILAELDEALAKVTGKEPVATNFLFAGNSADSWIKFANALKLKLYMRMSKDSGVHAALTSLVNANNFPTADIAWKGIWKNESGQANPFYQEEFATYFGSTQINVTLNCALERTMKASDDNRLGAFFVVGSGNEFHGGVSGTNFSLSNTFQAAYWSRPNVKFDDPVYLISLSEIYFFLSEYYAKIGNNAGLAKSYYEDAVNASFASAGVDGADAVLKVFPWDGSNYAKCIGIQKWVALSGINNYEAWCEVRRLGYPAFGTVTGNNITDQEESLNPDALVPGELYTPIQVNANIGSNSLLQRWPYAESSSARNSNTPDYKGDSTPIFWAE